MEDTDYVENDLENDLRRAVIVFRAGDLHRFDKFHFHKETMTFHGSIAYTNPWTFEEPKSGQQFHPTESQNESRICCVDYFYTSFECVLQFSPDGRYIRDGYMACPYFDTSTLQQYPLDGVWECSDESGEVQTIYVQFHSFTFKNERCHIFIDREFKARFRWPRTLDVQVSETKVLPGSTGPDIGEILHWESYAASWTRKSCKLEGCASVVRMNSLYSDIDLFPGGLRIIYHRVSLDSESDDTIGPTYHANTLWGNTFCQAFTVGLASYHFMSPNNSRADNYEAYISYENPKTSQWPNLDNGEPIPPRAHFRNIQWNEETRTFKGDILWMEDHGTTWEGHSKWMYEITFDPTYKFVSSGTCSMSDSEPHQFGIDLVYINAALDDVFGKALESASSTGEYIAFLRACKENGASESTMLYLGEVAMSIMNRGGNSRFDLNL